MIGAHRRLLIVASFLALCAFHGATGQSSMSHPRARQAPFVHATPTPALPAGVSTDWFSQATAYIRQSEYQFASHEQGTFSAPNRAQNLRTRATAAGVELTSRTDGATTWTGALQLTRWGRVDVLQPVDAVPPQAQGNRLEFRHRDLTEWYVNDARGLEQGFTISAPPATSDQRLATNDASATMLVLELAFSAALHATLSADGQTLRFTNAHGTHVLDYGALHVSDVRGQPLPAHLVLTAPDHFQIRIDDRGARYPLTVDPLMTTPGWSMSSDQRSKYGLAISTAGDVNGDGFSDILVGAPQYDHGETDEGMAFLYLGSAAGLSSTPAWTAEGNVAQTNLGEWVATAGDVNGDGFSDIVVTQAREHPLEYGEGLALVWYGGQAGLCAPSIIPSGLGPCGTPANADWTFQGVQHDTFYLFHAATAGDVNGDGYDDLLIGVPAYDNPEAAEGAVFLYYGGPAGLGPNGTPANADWRAESNQAGAEFGVAVATAGDVNGDGYADIIVGAHNYQVTQPGEGAAFVWYGSAAGLGAPGTPANADWWAHGNQAQNFGRLFGGAVATAGDVNGDGFSDILVGAEWYDNGETDEGAVFLWLGGATGLGPPGATPSQAAWHAESNEAGAQFGHAVMTAGDVNGDGFSDIIVGSIYSGASNEGAAFAWLGGNLTDTCGAQPPSGLGPCGTPLNASWQVNGTPQAPPFSDLFGFAVSTAGDVNGDGYSDVLVSAPALIVNPSSEGAAYLYYGSAAGLAPTAAWNAASDQADADFGYSVASAGDVNGDGYSDVLIGAPHYDSGTPGEGTVFLYNGSPRGLSPSPTWLAHSAQADTNFGWSVASAGDVNGDGFSDVLVGAPEYNVPGHPHAGAAFVWHGGNLTATCGASSPSGLGACGVPTNAAWNATSNQTAALFGWSVASAGDVNGDGFSDVAVGSLYYANQAFGGGAVFVWQGGPSGLGPPGTPANAAWSVQGNPGLGYGLGYYVASAGDVNRDGFSDLLVGCPFCNLPERESGGVFAWYGSRTGLGPSPTTPATASWRAVSSQAGAHMGGVASAGDVNGDGFSDVLVAASDYDHPEIDEGALFAWFGSATGLRPSGTPANADWMAESNQAGAHLGAGFPGLASAGDVNGDGFSDIIAVAPDYDNGETDEGLAFAWYGGKPDPSGTLPFGLGPSGIPANADWRVETDQAYAKFQAVASAGDVNGDGFSDVLLGAPFYDTVTSQDAGQARLYYGNEGDGLDRIPRQARVSDTALIPLLGKSDSSTSLRFKALGRTPLGRGKVQLEWEIKPLGVPFDFTNRQCGTAILDTGVPNPDPQVGSAVSLDELALIPPLPSPTQMYHWRLRVRGVTGPSGAMSPYFPHSPWLTIQPTSRTESKVRTP